MANTFNLEVKMELLEKTIVFSENQYKKGAYTMAFLPSLTYKYQGYERILDKLVYEVNTVRGTERNNVKTINFKILRPNCNPILLDDVELKGIELENLKTKIEEFVKSMESVTQPECI